MFFLAIHKIGKNYKVKDIDMPIISKSKCQQQSLVKVSQFINRLLFFFVVIHKIWKNILVKFQISNHKKTRGL